MLPRREGSSPWPGAALEAASAGCGSGARSCAMGINNSSTTWEKAKCQCPSLSACAAHSHLHPAAVLPSPTTEASFPASQEGVKLITWVAGLVSPPHYPLWLQWVNQYFLNKKPIKWDFFSVVFMWLLKLELKNISHKLTPLMQ